MAHHYNAKDGRILPSVTKVIGDMTGEDYKWWHIALRKKGYDPIKVLNDMGSIGTICHYRVLSKLTPCAIEMPDVPLNEYPVGVDSFSELFEMLWEQTGIKVENATVEKFSFDEARGYCGTYDLSGKLTGEVKNEIDSRHYTFSGSSALIDLKTSKEAREKHYLQLGAYFPFVKPEPDYGVVICLCPYTDAKTPYGNKNPHLLSKVYVLDKDTLMMYRDQYYDLLKKWWKING